MLTNNVRPYSGWGRCASDLIAAIRNEGHEVVVLKEDDDGTEGVPILKRGIWLFWSALCIRKYVQQCDVVHALDGYPFGIIAALANIGLHKRIIITGIGTYSVDPLYNWKTARLLMWAYQRARHVPCISHFTRDEILKKIKLDNISVVNLGIDVEEFSESYPSSANKFLLSVGALKYRKGYHISIPAFAILRREFPSLVYRIVGSKADSGYVGRLASLAQAQGVLEGVEFLGEVSEKELKRLYGRASVFILTSINQGHHFEGYGLVCLEAAATGLPIVGTKGNGIEDAVKDGYNGILVRQNDVQETAVAISDILKNEDKRLAMSSNGKKWAEEHDIRIMIQEYLSLYTT
jgi:glycosyltransferase involved in cell wall biosynthesis